MVELINPEPGDGRSNEEKFQPVLDNITEINGFRIRQLQENGEQVPSPNQRVFPSLHVPHRIFGGVVGEDLDRGYGVMVDAEKQLLSFVALAWEDELDPETGALHITALRLQRIGEIPLGVPLHRARVVEQLTRSNKAAEKLTLEDLDERKSLNTGLDLPEPTESE